MRLKNLARGVALYTLGNLVPRIGLFLLLPIYVTFMTPAEFGAMSLLVSIASLLAILYRIGLDSALLRFHFDVHDDGEQLSRLYKSVFVTTVAVVVAASLVFALAVGPFFAQLFVGIPFWPYGLIALGITATNAFQFIPTVWMRAREQPGRYLLFTVGGFLATAVTAVLLLVFARSGLLGGLLAQIAAGLTSVVVAAAIILRLRPAAPSASALLPLIRFGLPLIPHQVGAWVLNVSDRWMIGLWIGLPPLQAQAAIGVYSLGYQIGNAISLLAISVQAAWTPILYRHGDSDQGPQLHREMFTISAALFLTLAVAASSLAPEIVAVVAPPAYGEAIDVLRVVAFAAALYGLYVMLVGVIMLTRHTGFLPLITVLAAVANVAVNFVLLPRIGVMGAAWATLAAYGLYAVATYAYASRRYPLAIDASRVGLLLCLALGAGLVGSTISVNDGLMAAFAHIALATAYACLAIALTIPAIKRLGMRARRLRATTPTPSPEESVAAT